MSNRDFSKTAGLTPIFEARIVFYDQIWVYQSVSKTSEQEMLPARHVPYFFLLWRAAGRDGATRRDHRPKATARLQQL